MENGKKSCCSKLSVCNLGMSIGIVWGLMTFILVLLCMNTGFGLTLLEVLSSIYMGVVPSFSGAILGLFWGFIDGFIFGALIALVYNYCACKCPCGYCKKNRKGH
jgi:hypothetical protein